MIATLGGRRPRRRWQRRVAVTAALVITVAVSTTSVGADSTSQDARAPLPAGAPVKNQNAAVNAVSCSGLNTCVAVGSYRASGDNEPFVDGEVNGNWTTARRLALPEAAVASTATPPNKITELLGVACPVTGDCVAVGTVATASGFEPVTATETAGVWGALGLVSPPTGASSTGQSAVLNGVACATVGDCTAVGTYTTNSGDQESFSLDESGGAWASAEETNLPTGSLSVDQSAALNGVACHSPGDCTAVGTFVGTRDAVTDDEPYVVTETKGTWSAGVAIALPSGAAATGTDSFDALNAVSCPSDANCVAVGQYATSSGYAALAVTEAGGTWPAAVAVSLPTTALTGTPVADLNAIDCVTTTSCEAVGGDGNQSLAQPVRAVESNGAWSASAFLDLPSDVHTTNGVATGEGFAVHCFATSACLIAGDYLTTSGTEGFTATPTTPPNPPTSVLVASSNAKVTISWTAPGYTGGAGQSVTSYTATLSPGGLTCTTSSLSCSLAGLTNGVAYVATVTATNGVGTSIPSSPSQAATPATVPSAPTIAHVRPLARGLVLTITAPADNGAPILTYEFSLNGGLKWRHRATGTTSRYLTITALASKHLYHVSVRAVNRVGPGPSSPAVTATTK